MYSLKGAASLSSCGRELRWDIEQPARIEGWSESYNDNVNINDYILIIIIIARMSQMRTVVIPVVVGGLGVIKKGTERHLREIPGNNLQEIRKTALLGTAHILRKVLSIK